MQLWAINSARATMGGPSFESRTPCKAALFHWMTTFGCCANAGIVQVHTIANAIANTLGLRNRQVLGFSISSPRYVGKAGMMDLRRDRLQQHPKPLGPVRQTIDSRI